MRFATPHMLWLLLLVPAIATFMVWTFGRRATLLQRFGTAKALGRFQIAAVTTMSWVRLGLFLLGVVAIVTALARPQWGYHEQRIVSRGVDMMIAIDTSDSMMARDFQPNRLTRAKELLRNLIWEAQGARVGVVAFSGSAAVLCPLTLDYNMASTALKAVDVDTVSAGGTNIGAAIKASLGSFEISGGNDRVLILLTDGEQTEQLDDLEQAVTKAKTEGVKIFAIGIGAEDGAPIPTMRGFKRDSSGQVITTRLDFDKLKEIADKTQGTAIRAEKMGAGEIAEISAALAQFKGQKQQDKTVRIYHDRYSWFIGFALICFVLEALFSSVQRLGGWPLRRRRAVSTAAVLIALTSLASNRAAHAYPGEGYIRSREAYQEYSTGDYDEAVLHYERAAQLAPQEPSRLYNLGAAAAKAGKEKEARQALRSVFDAENPTLNANALYSAATLDHRDIREHIKTKKPDWEKGLGATAEEIEPIKQEIQQTVSNLKKVLGEYKESILTKPDDTDMKANFELAKKDLEELEKLLDQLNQEQQQQQQQEQPQQNEQQKDQNQENQQTRQSGQNQNEQQGEQGENKEQEDQQGQQQDQQEQQNQPEQNDGQNQQEQQDQQGEEKQDQQGEQKQDQNEAGQPGDQNQQDQQPDPKGTPAPTPTPSPTPTGTPRPGEGQGQQGQPGENAPPVPVGQMSPTDVDRLLNTLPPEDQRALQLMFGAEPNPRDEMQNDW